MSIFKAYDIRATVPDPFDPRLAYEIGWATARHLGARRIGIGRDARATSPEIHGHLVRGLHSAGVDVVDFGLIATPMLYYGVDALGLDGGVMITASHNPAAYNGLKICRAHAVPVGGDTGLKDIEALCADAPSPGAGGSVEQADLREGGSVEEVDLREGYLRHVSALCEGCPRLRVAIDCGNGMAAVGLEGLLDQLPLETERLYFEPDGRFPHHPADPLNPENLVDLGAAVRRVKADFGVAFDGDADRAIFVDREGAQISADLIAALLARGVLRRTPGATVLYDLRSSRATAEAMREAGGVPQRCRVGHSFIKAQMREVGAVFAGELSGHFYFRFSDTLVADDGIAAFAALLGELHREGQSLEALLAPLHRYAASGEINRRVEDVPGLLRALETRYGDGEQSHLDGLSVDYEDWWFNLRASNTEPVVRLNLEAADSDAMAAHRDRLLGEIEGHGG